MKSPSNQLANRAASPLHHLLVASAILSMGATFSIARAGSEPRFPPIGAGYEFYHTPHDVSSGRSSYLDISSFLLSAGLPLPENAWVFWQSDPIANQLGLPLGDTDTIVRRHHAHSGLVGNEGFVEVEVVAMSLKSVDPIEIDGIQYDVTMRGGEMFGHPSPRGKVQIYPQDGSDGRWEGEWYVDCVLTLTEVGNPDNVKTADSVFFYYPEAADWFTVPGDCYPYLKDFPDGGYYPGMTRDGTVGLVCGIASEGGRIDVVPARRIASWIQNASGGVGESISSNIDWANLSALPPAVAPNAIVADDFRSDARPIGGVHWWGSYQDPQDQPLQNQISGNYELTAETAFVVSFFASEESLGQPGELLGAYTIPRECVGVKPTLLVGSDNEPLWQYQINLLDAELDHASGATTPGHFFGTEGENYWVSVVAQHGPSPTARGEDFWGWHTSTDASGNGAVVGSLGMSDGDWAFDAWTVIRPAHGGPQGMAFKLLVSPATSISIHDAKDIVVNVPPGGLSDPIGYDLTVTALDENWTLTCDPANNSQFPVGTHDVHCVATASNGDTSVADFRVIVLEIQAPSAERSLNRVSLRGDPAPVSPPGTGGGIPAGATLFTYNHAFLNNAGETVIESTLSGAGAGNIAIFSNASGALAPIAVKQSASPAGPDYLAFRELMIDDDGTSAFGARTAAGDSHQSDSGTSTTLLAGSPPPGFSGNPLVHVLYQPALGSGGNLFSPATLLHGSGTPLVTALDDTIIWSSQAGQVAREGSPAAGLPIGTSYGQLYSRLVTGGGQQIAFAGNLSGAGAANAALWSGPPTSLSVVAQKAQVAPGTGGATFASFNAESISSVGTVVFRSNLNFLTGLVSSANNEGLWTDRSGTLGLVVREGDPAPCQQQDVRFGRFTAMFIDDRGQIVFFSYLKGGSVTSANDGSIWSSDPGGNLHLVAREGGIANNTDGSAFALLGLVEANDTSGILFSARLATGIGDTTTSNNIGIWRDGGDADSVPVLAIRKSDTVVSGGTPRVVTGIGIDYVTNAVGGTGGYGSVFNDNAAFVMKLSLTGGAGVFTLPFHPH